MRVSVRATGTQNKGYDNGNCRCERHRVGPVRCPGCRADPSRRKEGERPEADQGCRNEVRCHGEVPEDRRTPGLHDQGGRSQGGGAHHWLRIPGPFRQGLGVGELRSLLPGDQAGRNVRHREG